MLGYKPKSQSIFFIQMRPIYLLFYINYTRYSLCLDFIIYEINIYLRLRKVCLINPSDCQCIIIIIFRQIIPSGFICRADLL